MATSAQRASVSATAALTTALAAQDEEALRQFHAAYFDRLLRYQLVLARGDEHAAQEALQETFLRVARHARRFDEAETFWSWLTVLARSPAADAGRKRHRYWRLLAGYADFLTPCASPPAADEAEAELGALLNSSLGELPPEERSLVEGKYLRRATVRELASETGLTEKAVEARRLRETMLAKLRHENQT